MTTRRRFLSPAATLKRRALLVFVLAVFATPVKANELWVAPAKNPADKLIADFATAQKKTHFGFGVPENFTGFTRATVLLIGSKDQEIRYDLKLSISRNLASDTASVTVMKDIPAIVFKDQLLELDVSAIFNGAPALQPGTDYASLSIDIGTRRARRPGEREGEDERNENLSNETGNPRALLFGLRFQYAAPLGPAGPQGPTGPKGEMGNTGPQGPTGPAGTLATVMCPSGQALQGINANGTAACVPLAAVPPPPAPTGSVAVTWTVNGAPPVTACPAGSTVQLTLTGGSILTSACTQGTVTIINLAPMAYTLTAELGTTPVLAMTTQSVTVTAGATTPVAINFVFSTTTGSVQVTINCNGVACGKSGDLRVQVTNPSFSGTVACDLPRPPVAIRNLPGQTLVAGMPILVTLANVPAGSQCARAFLDVNGNGILDTGDAAPAFAQAVTVSAGQTTAVSVLLETVIP